MERYRCNSRHFDRGGSVSGLEGLTRLSGNTRFLIFAFKLLLVCDRTLQTCQDAKFLIEHSCLKQFGPFIS